MIGFSRTWKVRQLCIYLININCLNSGLQCSALPEYPPKRPSIVESLHVRMQCNARRTLHHPMDMFSLNLVKCLSQTVGSPEKLEEKNFNDAPHDTFASVPFIYVRMGDLSNRSLAADPITENPGAVLTVGQQRQCYLRYLCYLARTFVSPG